MKPGSNPGRGANIGDHQIMFIWKYIDIPQEEIQEIQAEFKNNLPDNMEFFQSININKKTFLGLELQQTVLIQMEPMTGLNDELIHIDVHHAYPADRLVINIPFENCEQSITKFWKNKKPVVIKKTPNGYPYAHLNKEECDQIDEFKLSRPVLFNAGIPHSVTNPQTVCRRAISLRFAVEPWHLVN